jgi:protein-S-isoprenylcysteine O-methyltransferase Ste14
LAEELMVLGTVLLVLSPAAILIAAIHWLFQLRRMINEEKVLRAVYADYNSYAAKTPRVIPSFAVHL